MLAKLLLTGLLLGAPLHAVPIAENGFIILGDGGHDAIRGAQAKGQRPKAALRLRFTLDAPARVWAEARGLRGLDRRRPDAAPEAFLDDEYLGPVRAEHKGTWRSPMAVKLGPGEHVLEIRCAAVADADDVSMDRVLLLSEREAVRAHHSVPSSAICEGLSVRKDWPANLHGRSKTLSVHSGRDASSGDLVRLGSGESWQAQVRIPYAPTGHPLPLAASLSLDGDRVQLLLYFDRSADPRQAVGALGYTPGVWQGLRLRHCGGKLYVALAQAPEMSVDASPRPLSFEIAARDLELSLKPAR